MWQLQYIHMLFNALTSNMCMWAHHQRLWSVNRMVNDEVACRHKAAIQLRPQVHYNLQQPINTQSHLLDHRRSACSRASTPHCSRS